jgi:hypothetical protein
MVVLRKVMVASLVQCTASMALLQIRITLVPLVQHTAFMALLNIRPTWKPPKKPVDSLLWRSATVSAAVPSHGLNVISLQAALLQLENP